MLKVIPLFLAPHLFAHTITLDIAGRSLNYKIIAMLINLLPSHLHWMAKILCSREPDVSSQASSSGCRKGAS